MGQTPKASTEAVREQPPVSGNGKRNKSGLPKILALLVAVFVCAGVVFLVKDKLGKHVVRETETKTPQAVDNGRESFKSASVGDIIEFGSYEQDNHTANGKEAIEWRVLDKEEDRILVISKYALDAQPYHTTWTATTWETCALRNWLNSTFISTAFTEEEITDISFTTVTADKNPWYDISPGNDTKDQIFLLSINEAEKYFQNGADRKCVATEYAIAQGAWTSGTFTVGGKATCFWWLRSPGDNDDDAAGGHSDGSVFYSGIDVGNPDGSVRPALWINLES